LGGTLCKIGSPLLSFLLCSLCTPLQKLKKEYQSQYADIESKHKDFHGRDDRSAKELMDLTVAFRKRIKTIRDKYNV